MANEGTSVSTLDGQTVEMGSAYTLNRLHLVALSRRMRRGSNESRQLDGLLRTLTDVGPTRFAVADVESDTAKQITAAVQALSLGFKPDGEAVSVWAPLMAAQISWDEWKAQRASVTPAQSAANGLDEAKVEAAREAQLARMREAVEKKAAERVAQAGRVDAAASVLGQFVSEGARTQLAAEDEREARQTAIAAKLEPFVNGRARVDYDQRTKRPVALVLDGRRVELIDFAELAKSVRDGVGPRHVQVTCTGCGKTESIGHMRPGKVVDRETRETRIEPVYEMVQLYVPAMRNDGKDVITNREGKYAGKPRRFTIATCRTCGGIAKRACSAQLRSPMSVWTSDIGPAFEIWCERKPTDSRTVASASPDGKITETPAPAKPVRNVQVKRMSAEPSGPIGDATASGAAVHPNRRDEGFVDDATALERAVAAQPTLKHNPLASLGARK